MSVRFKDWILRKHALLIYKRMLDREQVWALYMRRWSQFHITEIRRNGDVALAHPGDDGLILLYRPIDIRLYKPKGVQ